MYNNINRFHLLQHNASATGVPDVNTDFYYSDNSDRYIILARALNGSDAKIRYWFFYEITEQSRIDLGLPANTKYILAKQPFEVTITTQTYFESHEVHFTGAKGIAVEITDGTADVLVCTNHLNISNGA